MKKCNYLPVLVLILGISCKPQAMLNTVEQLDLDRYQGKWYEIARLPNSFERDLESVTATYTIKNNGKIQVLNEGYKPGGKRKSVTGTAWVPDKNYPGRLKVRFFWPFSGDYYVMSLDDEYNYALVGTPNRKFLWVLARQPEIDEEIYNKYLTDARDQSFNIEELIKVDQSLNINDNK